MWGFVMKFMIYLSVVAAIVSGCNTIQGQRLSNQTIEYQSGRDEYSVVVVERKDLTMADAKRLAQRRAAEMAYEDGYRYISLEMVQKTEAVKSDTPWPDSRAFHGNLYKELILDNDFDADRTARGRIREKIYSAHRFVFKAYKTKETWKAIDVCTLTYCE